MQYHGLVSNLFLSAFLYAVPFLLSQQLWWLIFIFPVPLLYVTRTQNVSFIHGYLWGCIVFALHLSGGIYLITCMAGNAWLVGFVLGIAMVLFQALVPAFLFWSITKLADFFSIHNAIARLLLWAIALWFFILWLDWYSLWFFGAQEGYPLMHPLLVLAQKPQLLCLLPNVGKLLLTVLFLLIPVSITVLLWYKNGYALVFFCMVGAPWLFYFCSKKSTFQSASWQSKINSLPSMLYSTADDPTVVIKIVARQIQKIIADCPATEVIVMPESAFNISNFAQMSVLLQLWNKECVGKKIHLIFGASRYQGDDYFNTLHWVYDGNLQCCYDKKHAMLLSERLSAWMNNNCLRSIYFSERQPIAVSCNERKKLLILQDSAFVPYICSEFFFNEAPDDVYITEPIIAIVNDLLFAEYMQKLLVLLAQFKAVQWQREIVYVSYTQSVFIDKNGLIQPMTM